MRAMHEDDGHKYSQHESRVSTQANPMVFFHLIIFILFFFVFSFNSPFLIYIFLIEIYVM